ncbi:MAG: NAD-dependent succinate-semialdehyde dehydrogenase, partial [Leptolyngbya sp.]|nr:NAD-dependent succinate-semialdehyde dehydrogenase [Leptolyngbya sp.]
AEAEVRKCALACRHYAAHAEAYLSDEPIPTDASRSFVHHVPLGPVLAVMPWNFPFWQVFRFAAPTLMAGNVGLLKHASNVWRCALDIEDVFRRAGFPEGCFQTLLIGSKDTAPVIRDKRIRAVTLTGSTPAGREVASLAGECLKPTLLELGGADAFIVMPSADLDDAVETAVKARIQNTGQSCIAAKRFLVHAEIYDDFSNRFIAAFDSLTVGDPLDRSTSIGPLATQKIRDDLTTQVDRSLASGASLLTARRRLPDAGWFYGPGILSGIPAGSPAADEELFGPVASLWRVGSIEEAVSIANRSDFGLGSVIFSREAGDIGTAIRDLEAGATFVNSLVASDPRLPFGGVKDSGYGRELAADGIRAFVNRKTVSIA